MNDPECFRTWPVDLDHRQPQEQERLPTVAHRPMIRPLNGSAQRLRSGPDGSESQQTTAPTRLRFTFPGCEASPGVAEPEMCIAPSPYTRSAPSRLDRARSIPSSADTAGFTNTSASTGARQHPKLKWSKSMVVICDRQKSAYQTSLKHPPVAAVPQCSSAPRRPDAR